MSWRIDSCSGPQLMSLRRSPSSAPVQKRPTGVYREHAEPLPQPHSGLSWSRPSRSTQPPRTDLDAVITDGPSDVFTAQLIVAPVLYSRFYRVPKENVHGQ